MALGPTTPSIKVDDLVKLQPKDWMDALALTNQERELNPELDYLLVGQLMEEICFQVQKVHIGNQAVVSAVASHLPEPEPEPTSRRLTFDSNTKLVLHRALAQVLATTDAAPATLLAGEFNELVTRTVDQVVEVLADLA